jgi:hypothetical protein
MKIIYKIGSKNPDNSMDDYTCYQVVDQRGCNGNFYLI